MERLDPSRFFALPVSDTLAPGYSQIIQEPMDFSTIRSRLSTGEYTTLMLFKKDFDLMCSNAMTYNAQDTVYYKTARKLRAVGRALLTAKRLTGMRDRLPFMEVLTEDELGFDIHAENQDDEDDDEDDDAEEGDEEDAEDEDDDDVDEEGDEEEDVSKVIEDIREVVRRPPGRFEAIPDDLTSQEILDQARRAARGAADRLRLHKPGSRMGFLRQTEEGSTSLSFLTSGGEGVVPGTDKDRPVLLGSLIGKVKQGTGSVQGFREDRRNSAKGVAPLYYGAYSSHGPTHDSTFASLTKEETEMVARTYGDEVNFHYYSMFRLVETRAVCIQGGVALFG